MEPFEDIISGFDIENVSDDVKNRLWEKGLPFFLKHQNKNNPDSKDALLIALHGFGATPYETRPIAEACLKYGIDVDAPLLMGHGLKNEEDQKKYHSKMKKDKIVESIRNEIKRARDEFGYKKIFIYGQSMGGALALGIAGEGIVDACAVTAAAIRLPMGANISAILLGWLNFCVNKNEPEPDFFNLSYPFHNSHAVKELWKISKYGKKNLSNIKCPVYIAHSKNDETISPKIVPLIKKKAKGKVEIGWFDKSGHTMPLDVQGQEVTEAISLFFSKML
ncbi:MAG: alpha/beta hydrolase [Promethearchaeota archaeon]